MNSKTVSLKEKKLVSEKLRNDNKKMEVRLQQLKLTMSKEKEERLLNGNSPMWTTGAPGAVLNYKPNLSAIDKNKKLKLKILKEEDEIEDKGPSQRQYIKHSFNGDVLSNKVDNNGREDIYSREDQWNGRKKCGQCEETFAAVNCKECTEVYCAKCFAAFHLKGALRKHRSTPISNISNRVSIPSPLFKPPDFTNFLNNSSRDNKESSRSQRTKHDISMDSNRKTTVRKLDSKENESPNNMDNSLADGTYDEAMSTQYFQDALNAWRTGDEAPYKPSKAPPPPMTEHSTETAADSSQKRIQDTIQFTSSLSYAEQLLLRKHRSCQLAPVEMKYILNRLAKNNETELLENQRLLQSNLILETSVINESAVNGPLTDDCHIEIGSLSDLWSEATYLGGRNPQSTIQTQPVQQFKVNEVISTSNNITEKSIAPKPVLSPTVHPVTKDNTNVNNAPFVEETNNLKETTPIPVRPREISKLKLSSRRAHSSAGKNSFNDRPQSSRRMSARVDKGGKIATKPSVLLEMLASFNEYLPVDGTKTGHSTVNTMARINSACSSRSTTKLNYNFYKIAPQSWKPAQAWPEKHFDTRQSSNLNSAVVCEETVMVRDEYDDELEKLDFLAPNSCDHESITPVPIDRMSSSNSDRSDDNQPFSIDVDFIDREGEEEQSMEQLETFERELTLISRKDNNTSDYDEIIADSLDLDNANDSLDVTESDKFHFEDSLDFQQRHSNNSDQRDEDSDDDLRNCSSRFNDYDDVHNLH